MFLIGLTGGIASGKSTVSSIFAKEYGVPVIDADLAARKVVEPNSKGWKRVVNIFGTEILNEDNTINRDKLGDIIFNDSSKRKQLNKCLHGLILFEMLRQIFYYLIRGYPFLILDVPLLFEFKLSLRFLSHKVLVFCDSEREQINRILKRNPNLTEQDALARISSQMKNSDRLKLADCIIDNSKDLNYTRKQIEGLYNKFSKSKKHVFIRCGLIATREICEQRQIDQKLSLSQTSLTKKQIAVKKIKEFGAACHPANVFNIFTIINLINEYKIRDYFLWDIISGLTMGIVNVPAGLANGAITSLNPIYGLYSSCFPGYFYMLFSTSKHLSVGLFAIVSVMILSTIRKLETKYVNLYAQKLNITSDLLLDIQIESVKLSIATGLAFWSGIFLIIFSFLNFGSITKYLSQPFLRGFTTAGAFRILLSQIPNTLGIYRKSSNKTSFKLFYDTYEILKNIDSINVIATSMAVVSLILLIIVKEVNQRFKKHLKNIPIPIELIIMVVGILISYQINSGNKHKIAVIGKIPQGIPTFSLPGIETFFDIIPDALFISAVTFASSISTADRYARKHKYKIDPNKEMFALGISSFLGSFLKCINVSGTLARTAVQEESGGKTQLTTFISSSFILVIILYLSPFLEMLPKACLSAILISAIISFLKQIHDLPKYLKLDKFDFILWTVTFLSSLLLNIDVGFSIGFLVLLLFNVYKNQNLSVEVLGKNQGYEVFLDTKKYLAKELSNIKIIKPTRSIYYVNCGSLRDHLNNLCPISNEQEENSIWNNCRATYGSMICNKPGENINNSNTAENNNNSTISIEKDFKFIVMDLSLVQYIDEAGLNCLKEIIDDYAKEDIEILLSNCSNEVWEFMKKTSVINDERIFLTIEDAIKYANSK